MERLKEPVLRGNSRLFLLFMLMAIILPLVAGNAFAASADDMFNPNANNTVRSIAVQADGKILVGGDFTNIGGQARICIARLSMDDAAIQELTVSADGTTITWMRSQSSPEVFDVTFWESDDMNNWTYLGAGTRIIGGWRLTGQQYHNEKIIPYGLA
jgi:hypothetical protein